MAHYDRRNHPHQHNAPSENFAGFGARRFQMNMEEKKREQERIAWERVELEREEYERHKWEEDQALYQQKQELEAWRRAEEERRYQEQYYASSRQQNHAQSQQDSAAHWPHDEGHTVSSYHHNDDHHSQAPSSSQPLPTSTFASSSKQPSYTTALQRSDTLQSTDTDSSAGLAYDEPIKRSIGGSTVRKADISNVSSTREPAAASRLAVPVAQFSAARETFYEDDFEEPPEDEDDINPAGWNRSSTYSAYGDETLQGPKVGSNEADRSMLDPWNLPGDITINRATVYEPELPKAKCADCGEQLSFEELSDHSCLPRGASSTSLLTLNIPSGSEMGSASPTDSRTPSPAALTPRSPFFDKYSQVMCEGGSLRPAFSTPLLGSTCSEFAARFPDPDESPRVSAIQPTGSQSQDPSMGLLSTDLASLRVDLSALAIQRSASDGDREALERKRIIEQQRAAKKMAGIGAAAATVIATMRLQNMSIHTSEEEKEARIGKLSPSESRSRDHTHLKQPSSSSLSSSSSSPLDPLFLGREREHSNGTATSAALTPSSSYDRFSEAPTSPICGLMPSSTGQTLVPYFPLRSGSRVAKPKSSPRMEVNLAGIEDLMKGLTDSPKTMSKGLPSEDKEEAARDRIKLVQESRSLAKVAATLEAAEGERKEKDQLRDTEAACHLEREERAKRERELEREIERLKEREKMRQLQRLRRKEKERRKRESKRCCVCNCSLSSSRTPFVERDGKLLCAKDWKELYLPKCRKCGLSVEKGAVKSSDGALKGVFHRSCFTCFSCDVPFEDTSFYVYGNQPYCSRHYHKINGSLCKECGVGVEGECRQTEMGDRYHPACLRCQYDTKDEFCQEPLAEYFVLEGRRLCEWHAEKVSRKLQKQGKKGLDLKTEKRKTMLRSLT